MSEVFIGTSNINGPFSIAMFDYQRVYVEIEHHETLRLTGPTSVCCMQSVDQDIYLSCDLMVRIIYICLLSYVGLSKPPATIDNEP